MSFMLLTVIVHMDMLVQKRNKKSFLFLLSKKVCYTFLRVKMVRK